MSHSYLSILLTMGEDRYIDATTSMPQENWSGCLFVIPLSRTAPRRRRHLVHRPPFVTDLKMKKKKV